MVIEYEIKCYNLRGKRVSTDIHSNIFRNVWALVLFLSGEKEGRYRVVPLCWVDVPKQIVHWPKFMSSSERRKMIAMGLAIPPGVNCEFVKCDIYDIGRK